MDKNIDELLPILYLKGISTGDFSEALESILGKDVVGISAQNIVRLKQVWQKEYEQWTKRELSDKEYVYWWADGVSSGNTFKYSQTLPERLLRQILTFT